MLPSLKHSLGLSRKIAGWNHIKPSCSAAPLTRQIVFTFAYSLLGKGSVKFAAVLLLSFGASLRDSEARQLCWEHIALPGDIRLSSYGSSSAGVNIVDAKTSLQTGRLQFVPTTDPEIITFLVMYREANPEESVIAPSLTYKAYQNSCRLGFFQMSEAHHSAV